MSTAHDSDLKIVEIKAYPTSFPVKPEDSVSLGVGRAVKRDAIIVKVTTAGGLVGWGESRTPYTVDRGGCVLPLEAPGLGVEVNETFLIKHPVIEEPSYV